MYRDFLAHALPPQCSSQCALGVWQVVRRVRAEHHEVDVAGWQVEPGGKGAKDGNGGLGPNGLDHLGGALDGLLPGGVLGGRGGQVGVEGDEF